MIRRLTPLPLWASTVSLLLFLSLSSVSTPCHAASLCGTVRDAQTLQPVPQAAVFLFDDLDNYTGLYAGTDVGGHYCIDDIPAGTYTLQVRIDDYVAAVVRDVVVSSTTGVDIDTHRTVFLGLPWPNPATGHVAIDFAPPDGEATTVEVYDVTGRLVKGWTGTGSGLGTIRWDLRDAEGVPIAPGIYLIRLHAGSHDIVRRFVRLR